MGASMGGCLNRRERDEVRGVRDVRDAHAEDVDAWESALIRDGVVRVQGLYNQEQIAEWLSYHSTLLATIDEAMIHTQDQTMPYLTGLGLLLDGAIEKQYFQRTYWSMGDGSVVLDLGQGRQDFTWGCEEGPLSDIDFHTPAQVTSLMRRLLKADYAHFVGAVPSRGKSDAGMWHRDTYSLFDDDTLDVKLPPYYYTMLIPLSDVSADLGPTQFVLGSHRLPQVEADVAPLAVGSMSAGDALIFDGRVIHRELQSLRDELRPVLYIVWHKKWYHRYSECEFKDDFQAGAQPAECSPRGPSLSEVSMTSQT